MLMNIMSKVLTLCIVVPVLMLAGCSSEQNPATHTTSSQAQLKPGLNHVSRPSNDNTAVDADVNVPAEAAVPAVDVVPTSLDAAKVRAALFKNEETSSEQISPGQWKIENRSGTRTCDIVSGSPHTLNTFLALHLEGIDSILDVLQLRSNDDLGNLPRFSDEAGLSFASRDQATEALLSTIKDLGLENVAVAKVYALDHQSLSVVANEMKASGQKNEYRFKADWTAADDCYFIRLAFIVTTRRSMPPMAPR